MTPTRAVWENGKKRVSGTWVYDWAKNAFWIALDSGRSFWETGEVPEWGNWRRVKT